MRLIVCGGRDYSDWPAVESVLKILSGLFGPLVIIEGGARGADALARRWAQQNRAGLVTVPAEWDRLGRRAGPARNAEMLKLQPDAVLAFPGGDGTRNMIKQARAAGVPVTQVPLKSERKA